MLLPGELADEHHARQIVEQTVEELGGLDILVNHVGTQTPVESLEQLSSEQFDYTFKVNIYSRFWTTKAALRHLPEGRSIINTASINGLRGNKMLLDYSATKGAVLAFTVFFAAERLSSYYTGEVLAPIGGETLPG